MDPKAHNLHLISDSTGETIDAMAKAALARFADTHPIVHLTVFVRNATDVDAAIIKMRAYGGFVLYTLSDPKLRKMLEDAIAAEGLPSVPALEPLVESLASFFDQKPADRPGMQHRLSDEYFERIGALDFAIAYDDGAIGMRLQQADVILTGVSRSSKTPTCIYLAYRGIKAANVPLVPGVEPDPAFFEAMTRGVPVVGLTASPSRLSQIRSQRLEAIGSTKTSDYAELDKIRGEVADARLFFQQHGIPVIDVTRRSIEETAAEVLALLRERGIKGA
ncbi:MAG: pyruvate, water dikinase regulatory protein [Paracoccaceae bacterium]